MMRNRGKPRSRGRGRFAQQIGVTGGSGEQKPSNSNRRPGCSWPAAHSMAWTGSGAVDLDHLSVRPLDRIGRRHALDRLRVHVDDDVLGLHLGGSLVGRSGIACQPSRDWYLLEGGEDRIDVPHLMIFPNLGGAGGVALLWDEPLVEDFLR